MNEKTLKKCCGDYPVLISMDRSMRKSVMSLCLSIFTDIDMEEYALKNFSRGSTINLLQGSKVDSTFQKLKRLL